MQPHNKIEISDDETIEGHPNIDHASLVRWRRADIHRKREEKRFQIANHTADRKMNQALIPYLTDIRNQIEKDVKASSTTTNWL